MLKYHKVHGVLTCAHILNEVISPDQICLICLCAYIGLHRFSMLLTFGKLPEASSVAQRVAQLEGNISKL